jgi:hypothetical protein
MTRKHGFTNGKLRFGSSQGLDYKNRTHCFIHIRIELDSSQALDSMNRIHGVTNLRLKLGCPQWLDYMNRTHGFTYIILGCGCSQGLGHATQRPLVMLSKSLQLAALLFRALEGIGVPWRLSYGFGRHCKALDAVGGPCRLMDLVFLFKGSRAGTDKHICEQGGKEKGRKGMPRAPACAPICRKNQPKNAIAKSASV